MPQWRDFLERFRPAGTPGAAAQGGVPADRIADTAAELEPVFMMLDDVHAEAARIRRCAVEHADAIRQTQRIAGPAAAIGQTRQSRSDRRGHRKSGGAAAGNDREHLAADARAGDRALARTYGRSAHDSAGRGGPRNRHERGRAGSKIRAA